MNIAKNMEFIFVAAVLVAVTASNAFAAPVAPAAKVAVSKAPIATVVVVGKRLTTAQKAKRAA